MISDGFVKLHKKIVEWEWYKDQSVKGLFIHLLIISNYKDGRFKGRLIKRGQVVTSINNLAIETGMSRSTIQRCLKALKSTNEIEISASAEYSLITVVNYDEYQGGVLNFSTQPSTLHNTLPSTQPSTQPSTNIRNKEKKERKNSLARSVRVSEFSSPSLDDVKSYANERGASESLANDFYDFYESNGWKVGKNAMRNWKASFNGWIRRHKDDIDDAPKTKMNIL